MSEYESKKGTIKKVELGDISLADKCREVFQIEDTRMPTYYKLENDEDCIECLRDVLSEVYIIIEEDVYKFISLTNVDPDNDIYEAELKENGAIDFFVKFYNGGQCLDEAIETAFNKIEEE